MNKSARASTGMPHRLARMLGVLVIYGVLILPVYQAQAQSPLPHCFADINQAYAHLLTQASLADDKIAQAKSRVLVDINNATEYELTSLKGIGSSKAQAIIRYRDAFGDFKDIDGLAAVKGIGSKTIDNNRARLTLSPDKRP